MNARSSPPCPFRSNPLRSSPPTHQPTTPPSCQTVLPDSPLKASLRLALLFQPPFFYYSPSSLHIVIFGCTNVWTSTSQCKSLSLPYRPTSKSTRLQNSINLGAMILPSTTPPLVCSKYPTQFLYRSIALTSPRRPSRASRWTPGPPAPPMRYRLDHRLRRGCQGIIARPFSPPCARTGIATLGQSRKCRSTLAAGCRRRRSELGGRTRLVWRICSDRYINGLRWKEYT